jgi:hypothetical protein
LGSAEHAVGGGSPGSIERQVSILNGRDKMRSADESPVVGSEQHQELVCRRCLIAIVRVSYHAVGEVGLRHRKSGPQDGEISAVLVRTAYRLVALHMKIFPHYRAWWDGCMIASVLEVKREILVN